MKNKWCLLIVLVSIGTCIYILQKLQLSLPNWINFYVNDFLIVPITLLISLLVLQKTKNRKNYQIPWYYIVYVCGLYSVFFEYYLPKVNQRYTADLIDVGLYFLGGLFFYWHRQRG